MSQSKSKKQKTISVEEKKVPTRKEFLEKKKADYTKTDPIKSLLDNNHFSIETLDKALLECQDNDIKPTDLYVAYTDLPTLKLAKDFVSGMDDVDTIDLVEIGTYKGLTVYTDSYVHPDNYFITKTVLV